MSIKLIDENNTIHDFHDLFLQRDSFIIKNIDASRNTNGKSLEDKIFSLFENNSDFTTEVRSKNSPVDIVCASNKCDEHFEIEVKEETSDRIIRLGNPQPLQNMLAKISMNKIATYARENQISLDDVFHLEHTGLAQHKSVICNLMTDKINHHMNEDDVMIYTLDKFLSADWLVVGLKGKQENNIDVLTVHRQNWNNLYKMYKIRQGARVLFKRHNHDISQIMKLSFLD